MVKVFDVLNDCYILFISFSTIPVVTFYWLQFPFLIPGKLTTRNQLPVRLWTIIPDHNLRPIETPLKVIQDIVGHSKVPIIISYFHKDNEETLHTTTLSKC